MLLAQGQVCDYKREACGFDYYLGEFNINFNYFHFFEPKRGVEFRHSTRTASKIRRKVGNGSFFNGERSVLTLGSQVPSAYLVVRGI